MRIQAHGGGQFTFAGEGLPAGIDGLHLRTRRNDDGSLTVTDVYVHGAEITNEALRDVSVPRLQASMTALAAQLGPDAVGFLDEQADAYGELKLAELHDRARKVTKRAEVKREPLRRPDGRDPGGFYRLVARAYLDYAAESSKPAKAVAEEARVPVTTAHRWVREARIRGFLPPGRKGRVG